MAISTEESSIGRYIDPEIYRAVLDEVHDGLMLADVNGRVVFWNRAAEKITGTRPEEAVGNDCAVLRVSKNNFNDGEGWNAKLVALVAGSGATTTERVDLLHKIGRKIPIELKTVPVLNGLGEVSAVLQIFRSIFDVGRSDTQYNLLARAHAELAESHDRIVGAASLDPTTELINRRGLFAVLDEERNRHDRTGLALSIVIVDMDNMTRINEEHGSLIGDEVLRGVADILRKTVRSIDRVGRFGGQEFLVILPDCPGEAAAKAGVRYLEAGRLLNFGAGLRATFSCGVAERRPMESVDRLIRRADMALFKAKKSGKNQVVWYEEVYGEPAASRAGETLDTIETDIGEESGN